jgi:hypothetical protein
MIRPWKVVVGVVLGVAAMPGSAMAQDQGPPTVTVTTPAQGAVYTQGDPVTASYSCTDDVGVTECTGTVANGAAISTATIGNFQFTVTGKDAAGGTTTVTRDYSVKAVEGNPGGETPATLNLTLGTPAAFAPFVPGIARDYTTSLSAQVLSTAENATLSVADASTTATGHLVNGAFALSQPLNAAGTSTYAETTPGVMGPVGSPAAPLTLLTYRAPTPGTDTATLNFKQSITAAEPLRTGAYAKTLTFTLSTSTP